MSRIRLILNCLGLTAAFLMASASRPEGIIPSVSTRQPTLRLRHLKPGKRTPPIVPHAFFLLLPPASLASHPLPPPPLRDIGSHIVTRWTEAAAFHCDGWWRRSSHDAAVTRGGVACSTAITALRLGAGAPTQERRQRGTFSGCVLTQRACAHRGAHFVTDSRARAFAREPMLTRVAGDINVTLSPCFMSGAAQRSVKIKRQREGGRGWKIENIPPNNLLTRVWPAGFSRGSPA